MPTITDDRLLELVEQRQQIADHMDAVASDKDFDPDGPEFRDLQAEAERVQRRITGLEQAREMRQASDSLANRIGKAPVIANSTDPYDIGSELVTSESFQRWKRAGASGRAKLMDIPLRRAAITTATLPPAEERVYSVAPAIATPLLNALNRQQVSSGSVEVVKYNNVGPAGIVAEGAMKPEATASFSVTPENLVTLAHWLEASRQIVEDETRLRDFISNSLLRGVYKKAETEAATKIQAATYATATGSNMMEALRVGIATVNQNGYYPNAILMNALDAAKLDYHIWDNSGGQVPITGRVWGIPVIASADIVAGSSFVGDFQAGVHHYYRSSAELFVTDSDVDALGESTFRKNVLTFLAEMRAVTSVVRPEAVAECSTGAPLSTRTAQPQPSGRK